MKFKKTAFTLADMVMAMGVISVIAMLTVPILKKDNNHSTYVAQLKKFNSTFQEGLQLMAKREGVLVFEHTSVFNGRSNTNSARSALIDNAMKKTFPVVKSCRNGDKSCAIDGYKYLDKTPAGKLFGQYNSFYITDGMVVMLELDVRCNEYNAVSKCGELLVDVNGMKKPNMYGRDLFRFYINKNGFLYPVNGPQYVKYHNGNFGNWEEHSDYWVNSPQYCGEKGISELPSQVNGEGCAARIIEDGWRMVY